MTRPRVSGSSKSITIISPWAIVENRAIAVPSGMTTVAKPIAVMNTEPIARPALNPQPALSLVGGNRSSCPVAVLAQYEGRRLRCGRSLVAYDLNVCIL